MTDDGRLDRTYFAYVRAFDRMPPAPFGISDEYLAEVLEQAVADCKPVPDDFDWWAHLPPGAVA
ncbi:MAG: hypothetical protein ACK5YQ_01470 [Betaproteobacteria bacterium]|jgi:hypothetical protein